MGISHTIRVMFMLARLNVINTTTITIWMFLSAYNGEPLSTADIVKSTGVSRGTVNRHIRILKALGVISVDKGSGTSPSIYHVDEMDEDLLSVQVPLSITSLDSLEEGVYEKCIAIRRLLKLKNHGDLEHSDTSEWRSTRTVMLQYFSRSEVDSRPPTSPKMFTKLYDLLESDVDLDSYADWFKDVKYQQKGFSWGIFLYGSMIEEYRDSASVGERLLRTSSDLRGIKHQENADQDEAFYREVRRRRSR